jgi:hypothetical protein
MGLSIAQRFSRELVAGGGRGRVEVDSMLPPGSAHEFFASFSNPEIKPRIDADVLRIQSAFLEWIAEPTTGDSYTKVVETLVATLDAYARGYLDAVDRESLLPQYRRGLRRLGSAFIKNAERQFALTDQHSEDRLREMTENGGDFISRKQSLTPKQQQAYHNAIERIRSEIIPDALKWNQWKGQLLIHLETRFEARYRFWVAEAIIKVQRERIPTLSSSADEGERSVPSSRIAEDTMPVDAAVWRSLRRDFETLQTYQFSLIWNSRAQPGFVGNSPGESHWSWWQFPDESLRARLSAMALRGALTLGYDSEDAWYDQLRTSEFQRFKPTGSSTQKQSDGTFVHSEFGPIHDVVKASITLCYTLEATARAANAQAAPTTESPALASGGEPGTEAAKVRTALGRNVDRLRKECGWSFDDLAKATDLDKKLILGHVNDGKGAHPKTLAIYACAFTEKMGRPVTVAELEAS